MEAVLHAPPELWDNLFGSIFEKCSVQYSENLKGCTQELIGKAKNFVSDLLKLAEVTKVIKNVQAGCVTEASAVQAIIPELDSESRAFVRQFVAQNESGSGELLLINDESVKGALINSLKNAETNLANRCVTQGVIKSGMIALVEFHLIWNVWKQIERAQIIEKNSREKLPGIQQNVETLKKDVLEMTGCIEEYNRDPRSPRLLFKIQGQLRRVTRSLCDVKNQICELRVDISGQIEILSTTAGELRIKSVTNVARGLVNLVQLFLIGDRMSEGCSLLQGLTGIGFIQLGVFNLNSYHDCQNIMKQLRDTLDTVKSLEGIVRDIEKLLDEVEASLVEPAE